MNESQTKVQCKHNDCSELPISNSGGYCKQHFIENKEKEYLDNSDPNNLGIIKWARDHLPHYLPNKTPKFHIKIFLLLLGLYHPYYRNKMERLLNLVVFRGGAKSTLVTMIFPSYILAHNGKTTKVNIQGNIVDCKINEKFICIVSETGEMAEDFAVRIRDEFLTNRSLRFFYKFIIEDAVEERTGKLTRRAFKFNGCFFLGIGSGMQIRGRIKGAYRVTLMIPDDIYSEKSVKTDMNRTAIRKWWNGAAENSVDDVLGKIAFLGTILHEDTVNVDLIRNPLWKTVYMRLMPLEKFQLFMEKFMDIDESAGACRLPFSEIDDEFRQKELRRQHYKKLQMENDWGLAWPDRIDLYYMALKIANAVHNRQLSLLYQEYFHEILPDSNKRFQKAYFQRVLDYSLIFQGEQVWFYSLALYPRPVPIKIVVGVDTASGTIDGDDAVVSVGGVLYDNRWIVFKTIYGKFSSRDQTQYNTSDDLRYGKVIGDRRFIKKIGYIDEAFRLAQEFKASEVKFGYAGNEKTIVQEAQRIFSLNSSRVIVQGRKQLSMDGSKVERITNTLFGHYSTFSVWHTVEVGKGKLEHELEFLGMAEEDNVADSLEVAFADVMPPQYEEYIETGLDQTSNDYKLEEARANAVSFFENRRN